jgi:hypothetical protein
MFQLQSFKQKSIHINITQENQQEIESQVRYQLKQDSLNLMIFLNINNYIGLFN